MRADRAAWISLALWLLASVAHAATGPEAAAKAAYLEGQRSFDLGRFDDAIVAYERAFALDAQPAFIFNIALAHRRQYELDGKLDHLLRARELYRNYLRLDPASPRRAGVERLVAELGAKIDDARKPAPPAPAVPSPPVAARPVVLQAPAPPPSPPSRDAQPPRSSAKTWTVIGVATALVIGAAITVLLVTRSRDTFDGPGVDLTPH